VRLSVSAGRCEPVFAGESAQFRLFFANGAPYDRPEVLVRQLASGAQRLADIGAGSTAEVTLAVPAPRRGWLRLGRVMLETRFPLGLFRAWSYLEPECGCLVYPRPLQGALPPPSPDASEGAARALVQGSEDFAGLRAFQRSDSPRHVAWKAVARTADMLTKQFSGEAAAELWLDWARLPPGLGTEERLSRLAGWVLAAERGGARYGLRLPGTELSPARGEPHRSACLRALALYEPQP
jgi:uncharacterized protein (DUF58 family)